MNRTINPFVYQRILEGGMTNSTIPAWLSETYSQCYEDIIIDSLLRATKRKIKREFKGITYVEIGANHPICSSSTYLWQRLWGTNGILVEANPKLVPELKKFRPSDRIINAAVFDKDVDSIDFYISPENEISSLDEKFVTTWKNLGVQEKISVPVIRTNTLLSMVSGFEVVILTIDVEGMDLRLLRDIDFDKHRPYIVEIEPSDAYAPGTSDTMVDFMKSNGYELQGLTDVNLIFVDNKKGFV